MPPERGRLAEFLEKYQEKNRTAPIIVEGDNDIRSLRYLGFSGEIIKLNSGLSLMGFSESVARNHREIILLTDMDRKGIKLKESLKSLLVSLGTSVDTGMWDYAREKLRINSVEDLPSVVERAVSPRPVSLQIRRHARY